LNYLKQLKDESQYFEKYTDFYLKYGPWAIVTGASSSFGKEFARQLAKQGLNLVLVSRRSYILEDLATDLMSRHGIQTVELTLDLKKERDMKELIKGISHLEIGLYICSAGFSTSFNKVNIDQEIDSLKSNGLSLLTKIWNDSCLVSQQCRAGIILMNSFLGTSKLNSRSYVNSLSVALDNELEPYGVDVVAATPKPKFKQNTSDEIAQLELLKEPSEIVTLSLKSLLKKSHKSESWLFKLWESSKRTFPQWLGQNSKRIHGVYN